MPFYVYVIRSIKDASYYIGSTYDTLKRLKWHNDKDRNQGKSRNKIPWEYHLILEVRNKTIGLKIEQHIKRMKSRQYVDNLKKYPEMQKKLIDRFDQKSFNPSG